MNKTIGFATCPLVAAMALAACGGDGRDGGRRGLAQPTPLGPQVFAGLEDSTLEGTFSKLGLVRGSVRFEIVDPPQHGTVLVNAATGEFSYTPEPDYFGGDSLSYQITGTAKRPLLGSAVFELANVNDAPVLAAIDGMTNSAETRDVVYNLPVVDVDGDELQITVTTDDPAIATVTGDGPGMAIRVTPGARGTTKIRVSVRDAEFTSMERQFDFTVRDVTKTRSVVADMGQGDALTLSNDSEIPVVFTIEHNGFPQFQSKAQMVEYVRNLVPISEGEPFEHKLWRFVRDNVYHNVPINNDQWLYDPWAAVNSLGWGFCGHVSAVYVFLARDAGYEARVWGLNGHVVPEIRIDGQWRVYDPDLAIYYYGTTGKVVGVEELSADSSLISSPITPLFSPNAFPYSQTVADIYGSSANNFVGDNTFLATTEATFQPVTLPPKAQLTYPGAWSDEVLGVDGETPYSVPHFLQARLTVPETHVGIVPMPWMLWEIRGTGTVRIDGTDYATGSQELQQHIHHPGRQISQVEVLDATSPIEFIYFINAMRYTLDPVNQVNISGKDVWAINVGKLQLPEAVRIDPALPARLKKPVP